MSILLFVGCAASDKYSIEEICKYVQNNQDFLRQTADISQDVLSKKDWVIIKDKDGNLKIYAESYGGYVYLENYNKIDDDTLDYYKSFFDTTIIESISYLGQSRGLGGVEMAIRGDGLGDIYYFIFFTDISDVETVINPLENYFEGEYEKKVYQDKNAVRWVSDTRYNFTTNYNVRHEVYLTKVADGIWVCKSKCSYPFYEFLFF